jgi:hypothetical protein
MPRTLDWSSLSFGRDKAARRLTAERAPPFVIPRLAVVRPKLDHDAVATRRKGQAVLR